MFMLSRKWFEGFDGLFSKLNIWDYITNTDNQRYLVNIEKLRDDISVGIVEYLPYYNELITQYKLKVRHPMT